MTRGPSALHVETLKVATSSKKQIGNTESATTMNEAGSENRFPRMAFPLKMRHFGLVNMLFKI